MKITKTRYRILGGIILLLLINFSSAAADDSSSSHSGNSEKNPVVASILQKHISDLNNQASMQLNQGDKEKVVQMAMCYNYLIVLVIASVIVFKTRTIRPRANQVLRFRH